MNFYVLTLFPEMITDGLNHSILKRAVSSGIINISAVNIRDFAENKQRQADDAPYGGGAGMVMMPMPVYRAYESLKDKVNEGTKVVYMTPQGKPFTQRKAEELAKEDDLIILCGHYEGIDERVIEEIVTDEISVGDYILTGGELPAMVVIDAISRLIKGVLSNEGSTQDESFSNNLLEYPQYTRPYDFMGRTVPDVLLSGHHKKIEQWRLEQSIERTKRKRPDLSVCMHNNGFQYIIREIKASEIYALEDMLYEAIYQPNGSKLLPREIIKEPKISAYIDNFGREDDYCLVADLDGKIIGAVWVRILAGEIRGYGNVDDKTPEFAISLDKKYRNQGIGTALMEKMIGHLKEDGYKQASLSVNKANYAVRMYKNLGFEVVSENEEDYLMVLIL